LIGVASFVLRQRADRIAQIDVLLMGLPEDHIYRRAWARPTWIKRGLDRYSSFVHFLNAIANALPDHPTPCQQCGWWVPHPLMSLHQLQHATGLRAVRSCAEVVAVLPPLTWAGNTRAPVMPAANVKPEGRSAESPGQSIEKSAVRSEETPTCEPFRHNPGAEE
jgi:hypothetical protein